MKRKLVWVTIFAIAMGFFEAAVVIYLRKLMYPSGFSFPLAPIEPSLAVTELLREAATLVMLLSIGVLSGRNISERFAGFIYSFAIWDIFYYVFLKLLIGWPASFMTWDILFLIPTTWTGPVITPVIVSLSMILLAGVIFYHSAREVTVVIRGIEWTGLIIGSLVVVVAFVWDYSSFILSKYSLHEIFNLSSKKPLYDYAMTYIPRSFNWFLFTTGQVIILGTIFALGRRLKKIPSG